MNLYSIILYLFLKKYMLIYTWQLAILNVDSWQILYILFYSYFRHILRYIYPPYIRCYSYILYILSCLYPPYIIYYLYFLYNLPNSTTSISTIRLTVYIEDVVGIEIGDIKDYTTEDHNTENTIKVIIETRPEGNIIFVIRKDIGL
jgi:hypothetical protein